LPGGEFYHQPRLLRITEKALTLTTTTIGRATTQCDTRTRFIPSTIQIPQPNGYHQHGYHQQQYQQQQYYGGGQRPAPNVIVVGQPTTPTKGGASGATTTTSAGPSYYPKV
jgi:hypothetical protein